MPQSDHHRKHGDGGGAHAVGRHHHRPRCPAVARVTADEQQHGPGHAVCRQHRAEQHRAAVIGEHVPGKRNRVDRVAEIRCQLARDQQPKAAVAQRTRPDAMAAHCSAGLVEIGYPSDSISTGSAPGGRAPGVSASLAIEPGDELVDLLRELDQLLWGKPGDLLVDVRGLAPAVRIPGTSLEPSAIPPHLTTAQQALERRPRDRGFGVVMDVREPHPEARDPPRPDPARHVRHLLDEPEPSELAQVKRAAGLRFGEPLGRLGRVQRTLQPQQLDQRQTQRVRQRTHRPCVGQLARVVDPLGSVFIQRDLWDTTSRAGLRAPATSVGNRAAGRARTRVSPPARGSHRARMCGPNPSAGQRPAPATVRRLATEAREETDLPGL